MEPLYKTHKIGFFIVWACCSSCSHLNLPIGSGKTTEKSVELAPTTANPNSQTTEKSVELAPTTANHNSQTTEKARPELAPTTTTPDSQTTEKSVELAPTTANHNSQTTEKARPEPLPTTKSQIQIPVPEHLTKEFWKIATVQKLKRKLKTIKNPNELRPDNDQSLLHLLVRHGKDPKMIPLLVSAGVDVQLKDRRPDGSSVKALIYAAGRKGAFLEEMLKHDTQVNEPGLLFYKGGVYMVNALMIAVYRRLPSKAVSRLLALGANPNLNYQGFFALMFAVLPNEYGPPDFKTIHILLDKGADKNLKSHEGKTAFDYLTEYAQKNQIGKKSPRLKPLLDRLKP